jgi:DNA-binding MarR family transcriptional regulator
MLVNALETSEGTWMSQTSGGSNLSQRHRPMTVDDVVDAVLASSRELVALSARSIAATKDVTLPQYRMLVVLDTQPSNLTELADALDVAGSTAMRMVDRLEAAGLVERTVLPVNRRVTHLTLTPAGRRAVRQVTARRRRDLKKVVEQIPAGRRDALAAAMASFAEAAERVWPSGQPARSPVVAPTGS